MDCPALSSFSASFPFPCARERCAFSITSFEAIHWTESSAWDVLGVYSDSAHEYISAFAPFVRTRSTFPRLPPCSSVVTSFTRSHRQRSHRSSLQSSDWVNLVHIFSCRLVVSRPSMCITPRPHHCLVDSSHMRPLNLSSQSSRKLSLPLRFSLDSLFASYSGQAHVPPINLVIF